MIGILSSKINNLIIMNLTIKIIHVDITTQYDLYIKIPSNMMIFIQYNLINYWL